MEREIFIYGLVSPTDPLKQKYVRYVGRTVRPEKRISQHGFDPLSVKINAWIKLVGRPNMLILESCSEQEWKSREQFWIKKLRRNKLLNISPGGGAQSVETRKKIGEAHKGEKNYNWGKHLSEETKRKLSRINSGKNHPQYGKPRSKETKQKLSKAITGKKNFNWGKRPSAETIKKQSIARKRYWRRWRLAKKG